MTCKRRKTAREDLAYVVKKFLTAESLDSNVSRTPTDSHTQTLSPGHHPTEVYKKTIFDRLEFVFDLFMFFL